MGLKVGDKVDTRLIHRLIAEAFIPNPDNLPEIDHINTKRDDFRIENLRWVDKKTNRNNPLSIEHYSVASKKKPNKCGKVVEQLDMNDNVLNVYASIKEAAIATNTCSSDIGKVCHNRYRYKTAGGFKWRFAS